MSLIVLLARAALEPCWLRPQVWVKVDQDPRDQGSRYIASQLTKQGCCADNLQMHQIIYRATIAIVLVGLLTHTKGKVFTILHEGAQKPFRIATGRIVY